MRLKQERHTVWLHFKRQACIIPALIRFPEVQSFPGSPKLKTKQSKTNPNICQQSDQCTPGVLKISAGMQAMSWAPNGSKSIQNQPPANTPSGNQHLAKLQLLSSGSFWALWDVESQYFVPVPGKEKIISPVPSQHTRHALNRGFTTLLNQVKNSSHRCWGGRGRAGTPWMAHQLLKSHFQ